MGDLNTELNQPGNEKIRKISLLSKILNPRHKSIKSFLFLKEYFSSEIVEQTSTQISANSEAPDLIGSNREMFDSEGLGLSESELTVKGNVQFEELNDDEKFFLDWKVLKFNCYLVLLVILLANNFYNIFNTALKQPFYDNLCKSLLLGTTEPSSSETSNYSLEFKTIDTEFILSRKNCERFRNKQA